MVKPPSVVLVYGRAYQSTTELDLCKDVAGSSAAGASHHT